MTTDEALVAVDAPDVLAAALDVVAGLVVVTDERGAVITMNAEARSFCGSTTGAGASFLELFPPHPSAAELGSDELSCPSLIELASRAFEAHLNVAHPARDGSLRWVRWTARFLGAPEPGASQIVATGIDLTAERAEQDRLRESADRYLALLDASSDVVLCMDPEGLITHVSATVDELLGYDPAKLLGRSAFDLVHADDVALAIDNFASTIANTADSLPMLLRVCDTEGTWIPFEVYGRNMLDGPNIRAVVVSMRNASERQVQKLELEASRKALRLAERQFRSSFDHAPIGMALVAVDGRFLQVNGSLCELVERTEDELLAVRFQEITHPDDLDLDMELLEGLLIGERLDYQMDKRYLRPDGSSVWAQLNVTLVRDEHGHPMHFVAQIQDISERRRLHEALIEAASHDSLTGLANRARFEERLAEASASATVRNPVTVVFLDLDSFKAINDNLGHAIGDTVLKIVAERMRAALRPDDLAARLGGDELAAILVGADEITAELVTARLRSSIAEPMEVDGHHIRLTASIGHVSTAVAVEASPFLAAADKAMYADKRSRP